VCVFKRGSGSKPEVWAVFYNLDGALSKPLFRAMAICTESQDESHYRLFAFFLHSSDKLVPPLGI